ncbi:glutathione S-transferase family protein [Muribacter muris]|uniref:Glutathione S-transferase family protein n=1 Tax=Muribacter muris TaxID=67855 RepID=A0A4Y9K4K9_9PAST|nr:glutathione S-transferase family protein [Muribacter muris]MBF0784242.1 glutathione S-transferase family protein [Muribacter muris]MBF0827020.1 glutathione S-transferase family protein [Muribacter muris]TFV12983.1 glutathione S-transferase family protein [Muribacter muris]
MLKLFTLPGKGTIHSSSPFAWKIEALLRLTGADFEKEYVADFSQMPKGKVPVLQDGEELIADSHFISAYLQAKYRVNLDHTLSVEQKAIGHAFSRMAEEHLYWSGVYNRFIDPIGKTFIIQAMFDGMPSEQAEEIFTALQSKVMSQMQGHGIGLHNLAEVYQLASADLDAISDYLGEKNYLFGDEITSADVAIVPVVASLIQTPIETKIAQYARSKANLVAYVERFDKSVFDK